MAGASAAPEEVEHVISIEVNGQTFSATLADNGTARAFAARLPMTLDMRELNGNEKYFYLNEPLPAAAQRVGQIRTGDLMLFGSDCVVLFYENFATSYTYTPIGRIDDPAGLAEALGRGSAEVAFS